METLNKFIIDNYILIIIINIILVFSIIGYKKNNKKNESEK